MVASLSVQGQQDPQAVNKPEAYLQKIVADGFVDTALQQNGGDAKKLIQDMQDGLQDAHKKGEMSVGVLATMKIILDDAQKSDDPAGTLKKGLAEQMEYLVQEQKKQEEQAKARLDQTERERLARETAQKPQEHSANPNEPQGELQQKIMQKLSAAFEGGKFDLQVLFSVMKEVMQTVVEEGQKKMAEAKQKVEHGNSPSSHDERQKNIDNELLAFKKNLTPEQLALFVKPERPHAPQGRIGEPMGYSHDVFVAEGKEWDAREAEFSKSLNPEQLTAWEKIKNAQQTLASDVRDEYRYKAYSGPTTYSDPKTTAATNGQPAPEGQRADRFNGMAQDTSQTTAQRVDPKVEAPAVVAVAPAANDPVLKVAGMSA